MSATSGFSSFVVPQLVLVSLSLFCQPLFVVSRNSNRPLTSLLPPSSTRPGGFKLGLLDPYSGAMRAQRRVSTWAEYQRLFGGQGGGQAVEDASSGSSGGSSGGSSSGVMEGRQQEQQQEQHQQQQLESNNNEAVPGACVEDAELRDLCEECAKGVKNEVVFPLCCAKERDMHTWCRSYLDFELRDSSQP